MMIGDFRARVWNFSFSTTTLIEEMQGIVRPDMLLEFNTNAEFLKYLASTPEEKHPRGFHVQVDQMLSEDPLVKLLNKKRNISSLKYFRQYRGFEHAKFHLAALALGSEYVTEKQKNLVQGLDREINSSKIVLPKGFVVFHGCQDGVLCDQLVCPTYISTTLHPVVAKNSAIRRARQLAPNGKPSVFMLVLKNELPALWGHTPRNKIEFELLLPRNLKVCKTSNYEGINFELVSAEIDQQ
jgi:hypothetical protein